MNTMLAQVLLDDAFRAYHRTAGELTAPTWVAGTLIAAVFVLLRRRGRTLVAELPANAGEAALARGIRWFAVTGFLVFSLVQLEFGAAWTYIGPSRAVKIWLDFAGSAALLHVEPILAVLVLEACLRRAPDLAAGLARREAVPRAAWVRLLAAASACVAAVEFAHVGWMALVNLLPCQLAYGPYVTRGPILRGAWTNVGEMACFGLLALGLWFLAAPNLRHAPWDETGEPPA